MTFRIWYADGSVVDGATAEDWAAAPETGVQVIYRHLGRDEHGRPLGHTLSGSDFYWLSGDEIGSGASHPQRGEMVDYDGPPGAVVKVGEWVDHFPQIMAEFLSWLDGYGKTREG